LRFISMVGSAELAKQANEIVGLKENEPRNFGGFTFRLKRGMAGAGSEFGADEKRVRFFAPLRECEELDGLRLRTRLPGDSYIPANARRAVKLKTLMIRRKIPLTQRDRYPVLVTADDRIVWSPGLPVAREFAPDNEEKECAVVVAYII